MDKFNKLQTTWNLKQFFKGDNDPQIKTATKQLINRINHFTSKWSGRYDYLTKPTILKQVLDDYERLLSQGGSYGDVGYYLWLRRSQDSQDKKLKGQYNKYDDLEKELVNKIQFFELKLGLIDKKHQTLFLKHELLEPYTYFLKKIFINAKYQLSEAEEKILTLKSGPAYQNWVSMVDEFINSEESILIMENGKKKKLAFEEIMNLINSQKKKNRDAAAKELNNILKKYADVAEHELNAILADKKINDELRSLPRPESSRFINDEISPETVDLLTQTITKRFDIAVRYYKLKAKLFKKKQLEYHERNVEYGELDNNYSLAQSYKIINKTFYNLDPKFSKIFKRLVNQGRIDVYPKKGKRTGAFASYTVFGPTYILLNFTNKLRDLTTIAHEFGHAINGEMMRTSEHALNYGGTLATAEVASTFMEDFVLKEIAEQSNDNIKLSIMMSRLNDDVSTIFRQIACHNFQQDLHKKFRKDGYVTKDTIGELFAKHMRSYMGPAVKQSKGSENWWVFWSHIRSYFYNYQYASGLLISKAMQKSYNNDPNFINQVKEFLSMGSSASFEDIFKKIGFNVKNPKTWDQGINEIESLLIETEKLAKKLKKI